MHTAHDTEPNNVRCTTKAALPINRRDDMPNEDTKYLCPECGGYVDYQRVKLGYRLCIDCGEYHARQVKHTIAPINKSNYMYISDLSQLKQLNPKRTT